MSEHSTLKPCPLSLSFSLSRSLLLSLAHLSLSPWCGKEEVETALRLHARSFYRSSLCFLRGFCFFFSSLLSRFCSRSAPARRLALAFSPSPCSPPPGRGAPILGAGPDAAALFGSLAPFFLGLLLGLSSSPLPPPPLAPAPFAPCFF